MQTTARPQFSIKTALKKGLSKIHTIYRAEGYVQVLCRILAFTRDVLFWNKCLFLYERVFTNEAAMSDKRFFRPLPRPFHLKVVYSKREADKLEMDGFKFRTKITHARHRLDAGAIAFCIFHENELANSGWVALSRKAQLSLPERHIRINFEKNESVTGGSQTEPEFRRMGLMTYNLQERCNFLKDNGIVKDKSFSVKWNIASRKAASKAGYRIRGMVGFKNRPGRRIWKEWPIH